MAAMAHSCAPWSLARRPEAARLRIWMTAPGTPRTRSIIAPAQPHATTSSSRRTRMMSVAAPAAQVRGRTVTARGDAPQHAHAATDGNNGEEATHGATHRPLADGAGRR